MSNKQDFSKPKFSNTLEYMLELLFALICFGVWKFVYKIDRIEKILKRIEDASALEHQAASVVFYEITNGAKRILNMKLMKVDQTLSASVAFLDKKGNPAVVDGAPVWGVSDEKVAKVEAAADGMSAVLTALMPGSVKLLIQADADLGEGVKPLVGESEEIVISALDAESVSISVGEPA